MVQRTTVPRISVVIPTFNRAGLLRASLESLTKQTLPVDDFEVVVVNDGSSDATEAVCQEFAAHVRIRYQYIKNSGISAAKNLGIFSASAPLLLFFDDDDIASPTLLEEHLRAHEEYPDQNVAVLGYTAWAPSVEVTPIMEYVIDIGQQLFAYKNLRHGQRLDYTYFWGGRSSCKRPFLTAHGIFNQSFRAIIEDIELGYRLSKFNLTVVFDRRAISHMVRPITFDDFCRRSERQGAALYLFSRLHDDPRVQQYCQVQEALSTWETVRAGLAKDIVRIMDIETTLAESAAWRAHAAIQELQTLYKRSFTAFRFKGIVEAAAAQSHESPLFYRRSHTGTAVQPHDQPRLQTQPANPTPTASRRTKAQLAEDHDRSDNERIRLLLAAALSPTSNCIDIGCHRGALLKDMLRFAPDGRHIAFEPIPLYYDELKTDFPQVDVRCAALSSEAGESDFRFVVSSPGYSGLKERAYPGEERIEMIRVRLERLDAVLPEGYAPDLIKIDVEGGERQVIEGAMRTIAKYKPLVIFEHGRGASEYYGTRPEHIFDLLCVKAGLRLLDLDGNGPYSLQCFVRVYESGERWNFVARR